MPVLGKPKMVILGAGLTGLSLAWKLAECFGEQVVILEKEPYVGGMATTLFKDNFYYDLGSHRFHEETNPRIMELLKELCGQELLKVRRYGKLFMEGREIKYPPSPFDILLGFGLKESLKMSLDLLGAIMKRPFLKRKEYRSYESFMIKELGRAIYERFYKPYALKLWNMPPSRITVERSVRNLSKFQLASIITNFREGIYFRPDFYYYPAQGIGYIARRLKEAILSKGVRIVTNATIREIISGGQKINKVIFSNPEQGVNELDVESLVSTIPLSQLQVLLGPDKAGDSEALSWRSLRFLYLRSNDVIPSKNEAYYFPEPKFIVSRVSELNKYSPLLNQDKGFSFLTVEVICSYQDPLWNMKDEELFRRILQDLVEAKILRAGLRDTHLCFSAKLRYVYPMYKIGWKKAYAQILDRLSTLDNLYIIGRSALFLHCNMEHCLLMGIKLAEFLGKTERRKEDWIAISSSFHDFKVKE